MLVFTQLKCGGHANSFNGYVNAFPICELHQCFDCFSITAVDDLSSPEGFCNIQAVIIQINYNNLCRRVKQGC